MLRMITMHARLRQTDEHHGNSSTICSVNGSRANKANSSVIVMYIDVMPRTCES